MRLPVVSKFVVRGDTQTGLQAAKETAQTGVTPILNQLGEHYSNVGDAEDTAEEYEDLIEHISDADFSAEISVKPTQLGLNIAIEVFQHYLEEIAKTAYKHGVFIWVDMEGYDTKHHTVNVYTKLIEAGYGNVGLCLQANLRETPSDIHRLAAHDNANVRLVKGAYKEPLGCAYQQKPEVDRAYTKLIGQALDQIDGRVAVGTHDEQMIQKAIQLSGHHGTDVEFQMLKGVREDRQEELAEEYQTSQYVPYGNTWLAYTFRRMKENPANIKFIFTAIYNALRNKDV